MASGSAKKSAEEAGNGGCSEVVVVEHNLVSGGLRRRKCLGIEVSMASEITV